MRRCSPQSATSNACLNVPPKPAVNPADGARLPVKTIASTNRTGSRLSINGARWLTGGGLLCLEPATSTMRLGVALNAHNMLGTHPRPTLRREVGAAFAVARYEPNALAADLADRCHVIARLKEPIFPFSSLFQPDKPSF
jgi:hypothetical protein